MKPLPAQERIPILLLLGAVAIGLAACGSGEKEADSWLPYQGRGRVSEFLLKLGGGPTGLESIRVPEGFEVTLAAGDDLVSYGVFFTFDDRGRLFVCESAGRNATDDELLESPSFRIRLLEDDDGDGVFDRSKIFADGLTMALGAEWIDGSLYVAAPPDLLRLDDLDGDGVADRREVVLTGWPIKSNATTLHGPYLGPDGWIYLTYSPQAYRVRTKEGTLLEGPRGRVFRAKPDGTRLEWFVGGGFDNPVEVVFTSAGETIGTNTYYSNPKNGVRDSLLHYVDGGVYPKWRPFVETAYRRTGDFLPAVTKFARIAPSGLMLYRGEAFGPDYKGNLFSAQFNPHRVQRHILHRTGGTFRTDDEDFLTSTDIDLHVTDVVEDADGSMLVLDTGAWYLHGCPVSRIAKPQYRGAIFRVRRKDAAVPKDPWGRELEIDGLGPSVAAALLSDPRPRVRDRARDRLIGMGAEAVDALGGVRGGAADEEARASAVFALGRIDGPEAREGVRAALDDPGLTVRVAAARMAGLNEDGGALDRLSAMARRDEPAARRQAAEALGRIGDPRAVEALIAASADPEDRFVEHAIIYALIRLETPEPLVAALGDPNPRRRKAALIALDQMNGRPLTREQFAALLGARDDELAEAVLWVAGHRPEWARDVLGFLRARLEQKTLPEAEAPAARRALLSLCSDAGMQRMTADLLGAGGDPERLLFLLDAIHGCALDRFPASWVARLGELLEAGDERVRLKAASLIAARRIADLDERLEAIADSARESDDLRVAALAALVAHRPGLEGPRFRYLLELLDSSTEADLRLSAAQALSRARLESGQLVALAEQRLVRADPLVLPTLLNAYRRSRNDEAGRAMAEALLGSREPLGSVAAERLRGVLENFSAAVGEQAAPLLAEADREKERRAERLMELEPLLRAGGDPGRGRNLFFGRKAACASCHTIGEEGGHVGPDLTAVGSVRSGIDILEAIVFPSASFVPGSEVYRVETADEVYSGVRGESSPDAVTIISGPREQIRIPRSEIVSMEPSTVSLMPDGFDKGLSPGELTDLLSFLRAQKSRAAAGDD